MRIVGNKVLGIRSISDLPLPAFLTSIYSTRNFIGTILSPSSGDFKFSYLKVALNELKIVKTDAEFPTVVHIKQKLGFTINTIRIT